MKAIAAALALFLALAGPAAAAGACQDGLAKVDAALQSPTLAPDVKSEVQDMRAQAQQLCDAGNEDEGKDILNEAIALLGVE
jgi:hypothetical protein